MSNSNSCSTSKSYSCSGSTTKTTTTDDEQWRKKLTPDEFHVAREHGTEPPFTGKYYNYKGNGIYTCVCCETELFSSKNKYDSGSGWPSFYDALKTVESSGETVTAVGRRVDTSHGTVRTEIFCKNCNSHLGHVFDDGPPETGERYCVNSLSLKFRPKE